MRQIDPVMSGLGDPSDQPAPVVEAGAASVDGTTRTLQLRIRQQEILAELGVVDLKKVMIRHWSLLFGRLGGGYG